MKKFLLRFSVLLLVALSLALAEAQPTGASSREPARDEVTVARAESPELANRRVELEMLKQRFTDDHPQVREARARIEAVEKNQPWLLSLDFPGGSLSKFLTLVARAKVVSINLVSPAPNDLTVELPAFSLRNADARTIVRVLATLLEAKGYSLPDADGSAFDFNSVTRVLVKHPDAHVTNQRPPTIFESFSITSQLADYSIDEIVATIREGWELDPAHDRNALRLKFHPATHILLVSGPVEAIQVATRVISQIRRPDARTPAPEASPRPENKK